MKNSATNRPLMRPRASGRSRLTARRPSVWSVVIPTSSRIVPRLNTSRPAMRDSIAPAQAQSASEPMMQQMRRKKQRTRPALVAPAAGERCRRGARDADQREGRDALGVEAERCIRQAQRDRRPESCEGRHDQGGGPGPHAQHRLFPQQLWERAEQFAVADASRRLQRRQVAAERSGEERHQDR